MKMVERIVINWIRRRWYVTTIYSDDSAGDSVPFETREEAITFAKSVYPFFTEAVKRRRRKAPEPDL